MEDSELELVDALPYLDNEYENADMKREVDAMIAEEMKKFVPKKYLTDIPELFKDNSFLQAEFARVASLQGQETKIDESHYKLTVPTDPKDPESWKRSVSQAQAVFEYQQLESENIELAKKYGGTAWNFYNKDIEGLAKSLDSYASKFSKDGEQINKKRKIAQTQVELSLRNKEEEWYQLAYKNNQISLACFMVENQLRAMKENLPGMK